MDVLTSELAIFLLFPWLNSLQGSKQPTRITIHNNTVTYYNIAWLEILLGEKFHQLPSLVKIFYL